MSFFRIKCSNYFCATPYDMMADGFSLDDKRQPIADNDIPDLLRCWQQRDSAQDTNRKGKAFFVPREEIQANAYDLSINRYKEIEYEEVSYEPPKALLIKFLTFQYAVYSPL